MNTIKRVNYLDNLRAIACIAVILLHISGPYLYSTTNRLEFQFVNFIHSLTRFCVPVFLMLTGALLLGKNHSWKLFYKERIPKVLKPLVFWSVFYIILYILLSFYLNGYFSYVDTLEILRTSIIYGAAYHLWYMYLIISIYLVLPFLSNFNQRFYIKHVMVLVFSWLTVLATAQFIPELQLVSWLRFIIGYFGYLVLGYLCSKLSPNLFVSGFIFIVGLLGTFLPNVVSVNVDFSWFYYLNINVVLLSTGLFFVFKSIDFQSNLLSLIAQNSFGIYFIHLFYIMLLNKIVAPSSFYAPLQIVACTIICLTLSFFTIISLKRIKFLAPYIY